MKAVDGSDCVDAALAVHAGGAAFLVWELWLLPDETNHEYQPFL